MQIPPKQIPLRGGRFALLRSAEPEDAAIMLEHLRQTSGETDYLARYPEEVQMTEEEEAAFIRFYLEDPENFMLTAWINGQLAATASLNRLRDLTKYRHRGEFSISVRKKYQGMGLGSIMTRICLYIAQNTSLEQVELSVSSGNAAAIHVYEKLGFRKVGAIPRAYRLKDGTYFDEILMVCDTRKEENL